MIYKMIKKFNFIRKRYVFETPNFFCQCMAYLLILSVVKRFVSYIVRRGAARQPRPQRM